MFCVTRQESAWQLLDVVCVCGKSSLHLQGLLSCPLCWAPLAATAVDLYLPLAVSAAAVCSLELRC